MGFTGRENGGNDFLQCNGTQSLFHRLYSYSPATRNSSKKFSLSLSGRVNL